MARIEFRPMCSECKQIIFKRVDICTYDTDGEYCILPGDITVDPYRCPNCGAPFDKIVMATKLPFDRYPEEGR